MALTLDAVARRAREPRRAVRPMSRCLQGVAHGSLMGARGNSGVILSQLLRGMAERFGARAGRSGPAELADALVTAERPGPPGRRRPGGGHHPHRRASGRRGAHGRRQAGGGPLVEVVESARAGRRRGPGPDPRAARRCWPGPASSTPAGPATCSCSTRSSPSLDGRPLPEPPPAPTERRARTGSPNGLRSECGATGTWRPTAGADRHRRRAWRRPSSATR